MGDYEKGIWFWFLILVAIIFALGGIILVIAKFVD